jgi:transcriptional regulator with XRE-family HTH domain
MRIYLAEESGELKSLGSYLKNKRRSKSLSIKKVAEELRIKEKYIKAMEKDQLDQLPTQAHQKIFVKTYSEFLGVDFNKLKKSFEIEHEEPIPIGEQPEQGSTFFPVLAGFVIGVICILVFVKHIPEQESSSPVQVALNHAVIAETSSLSTPGDTSLVEMMTLRLESKEDSWVQVIADKDTLFNGILHQRTAWECKARDEFMINIARSWAVAGFVDGRPLLPFGSQGELAKKRTITKENYPSFLDSSKLK